MRRNGILLVTPPYHCGVVEAAGHWVPLTLVYLAASARQAGLSPIIYDAMTKRHSHDDIAQTIQDISPAYVAVTAITATYPDAIEVLETAKKIDPNITTLIGGVHTSFLFREALASDCVDFVVRGEGEESLRELLTCLEASEDPASVTGIAFKDGEGGIVETPARPYVDDLDSLSAAWDLLDWDSYTLFPMQGSRLGSISTSRGCEHDCKFCSQQKFWQKSWRARKPALVVDEIEMLRREYGVDVLLLVDEYPTGDRDRWEQLLDLLIERDTGVKLLMETRPEDIVRDKDILVKYRAAGIIHIYIGVEATNQETLDLIKKDVSVQVGMEAIKLLAENEIITETSFILGFPHETEESIRRTLELSKAYNPDFGHYLALAPWPYADMYEDLKPYVVSTDYRKYNLIDPVIKPEAMSCEDVDRAMIECYRSFYMGKLKDVVSWPEGFKKDYMLKSMKLIMNSSFITDKMGSLGKMPPEVVTMLREMDRA